jgi:hypothetical protein
MSGYIEQIKAFRAKYRTTLKLAKKCVDAGLTDDADFREMMAVQTSDFTIRDQFAMAALTGLLSGSPDADCGPSGYAHDAYLYADAMLNAREV